METNQTKSESFDENQSLRVIREMIEVSRKNLRKDGILFILWGWVFFMAVSGRFLIKVLMITSETGTYINNAIVVILIGAIIYTINYLITERQAVRTYTGQILRYLWGAIIFLNAYILFYQLRSHINFDALYSQYMLMLALGTFVTGGIIKFRPLIYGSISFILWVQIGFFFHNEYSILFSAISFITGLAIPGHLLYRNHKIR